MQELDIELDSGRVHAQRFGPAGAPLILAVHGLSANMHAFDALAPGLIAGRERQLVALDLRGRGRSDVTPPGTYGLRSHARDVLQAAERLGAEQFDWIGWSMGALIAIHAANMEPERLRTVGLIDHAGAMDEGAVEVVRAGLNRLDIEAPDAATYVACVEEISPLAPFSRHWRDYYTYEFGRTNKAACEEDLDDVDYDWPALWPALTMPTTLVRCAVPLPGGFIVPPAVARQIAATAPRLTLVEVDADHFTVMAHEDTAAALAANLDQASAYA